jgi:hypothetical protein
MEVNEGFELLTNALKNKDWFRDVGVDKSGRYVVYVSHMNMETMTLVPDNVLGKQVLVHYFSSKNSCRENFVSNANHVPFAMAPMLGLAFESDEVEELSSDLLEIDVDDLISALERLEKDCGSNTLQDIFYEIHDGKNAVTNLSARYPEVRNALSKLYDEYGFDIVYEELDG